MKARAYRFHGLVALDMADMSGSVYMTPSEARKYAMALIEMASSCELDPKWNKPTGTVTVEFDGRAHGRKGK